MWKAIKKTARMTMETRDGIIGMWCTDEYGNK